MQAIKNVCECVCVCVCLCVCTCIICFAFPLGLSLSIIRRAAHKSVLHCGVAAGVREQLAYTYIACVSQKYAKQTRGKFASHISKTLRRNQAQCKGTFAATCLRKCKAVQLTAANVNFRACHDAYMFVRVSCCQGRLLTCFDDCTGAVFSFSSCSSCESSMSEESQAHNV